MARNRMIKPEFWEDDKIAECSPMVRLLFVALWNFADDQGYLEYRPKWIKTKCLPYDDAEIEPLIDQLLKVGCLSERNGILWIKNFLKHQKIDRPNPSNLGQKYNDSTNVRRVLDEHSSPKDKIKEDKIKEDKTSETVASATEPEAPEISPKEKKKEGTWKF